MILRMLCLAPSTSIMAAQNKRVISYLAHKVIIGKTKKSHLLYVPNNMFNFWSKRLVHNLDHCFINLFSFAPLRRGLSN